MLGLIFTVKLVYFQLISEKLLALYFLHWKELSFCPKLNVLIPIYLQPDGVHLWYFKLRLFDPTELIVWNI